MRGLLFLPLVLVAAPKRAEASTCYLGPYTTTMNPALGCEVVVYDQIGDPDPVEVFAKRGDQYIDVTGTVMTTPSVQVDVRYTNYDCDGGVILDYTAKEPYDVHRVALVGAQVGDQLDFEGISLGTVAATGACVEDTAPDAYCTGRNSGYPCPGDPGAPDAGVDDDDKPAGGGGCNAAGSAGLALVALFAQLFRRRRS